MGVHSRPILPRAVLALLQEVRGPQCEGERRAVGFASRRGRGRLLSPQEHVGGDVARAGEGGKGAGQ